MSTSRRDLLKSGSLLGAGAVLGLPGCGDKDGVGTDSGAPTPVRGAEPEGAWEPEGSEDLEVFSAGVQVGDVTEGAALLSVWTSAEAVIFRVAVQEGSDWVEHAQTEEVVALDGVAQVELTGLEADTAWSVVAALPDGSARSRSSRFRTALGPDGWRVVVFGATSCLGGNEPWPSMSALAAERPDFFCLLGDTIYADNWEPAYDFPGHWSFNLGQQGLRDLSASTSLVAAWDDHEVDNNWSWTATEGIEERVAEGLSWFRAALPQREGGGSLGEAPGLWRRLSWGAVLELFVLDCRGERAGAEYLSEEQLAWLEAGLSQSTARFKIILSSVPITDLTAIFGTVASEDRWQGYPAQRSRIIEHVASEGIEGVLWVAGDLHFAAANRLDPEGGQGWEQWEIMAGPAGSFLNIGAGLYEGDRSQFPVLFDAWNCTRFECDPGTGTVHVSWIGDDGAVIDEITLEL